MIILVFGLPGTGKTYFSERLSNEIGAVHINTDMVRKNLHFEGHYDEKTKQQVYNELIKHVQREIKKGSDVLIDGTFHRNDRRLQVKHAAEEMNQQLYIIEMKAGEEIIKKRMKKNRKYSEADFGVYSELKSEFEPANDKHLKLQSDDENIQELIAAAKKYIYG